MSATDFQDRLEALETKYERLERLVQEKPSRGKWRDVVGMFADDPAIQTLHREAAQIRQQDRITPHDRDPS